jgi:hypothetical protein
MNSPLWMVSIVNNRLTSSQINGDIIVQGIEVKKIIFDNLCFIPESNDKFVNSMNCIDIHDMPENRFTPNFHHRFGA